jgi:hypothetical protein
MLGLKKVNEKFFLFKEIYSNKGCKKLSGKMEEKHHKISFIQNVQVFRIVNYN